MKDKVFIFDFDGVMVDSFEEVLKVLNGLADKYGFKKVDLSQKEYFRTLSSRQLMEAFGISAWKLVVGVRPARKAMRKTIFNLAPVLGMPEVLRTLKRNGHSMGIITANSVENVNVFLKKHKMEFFDFVMSGGIFFKHRNIKRCLKAHEFNPQQVYYVGDETRDIEAAKKSGVKSVAVSWGFSTRELLEKYQPDYLLDKPEELLELVRNL